MRHIVITGASSGLGAALAHAFASRGDRLTLLARDQTRLANVAQSCRELGSPIVTVSLCDVRDEATMRNSLVNADDQQPVDIVIANAGIGGRYVLAAAGEQALDVSRNILETNTLGVLHTVAPLLGRMVSRRQGRIGLISSIAGQQGLPESPVYSASKSAVTVYGEGLRRATLGTGVSVTTVCPGFIDTPMSQSLPFYQPFAMSAERAAQMTIRAIEGNRRLVVFPWQLRLAGQLHALLPAPARDWVLKMASAKTRMTT